MVGSLPPPFLPPLSSPSFPLSPFPLPPSPPPSPFLPFPSQDLLYLRLALNCCIVKDNLELSFVLPLLSKCWDYRCASSCPILWGVGDTCKVSTLATEPLLQFLCSLYHVNCPSARPLGQADRMMRQK